MKSSKTLHLQASINVLPEVVAFIETAAREQSLPEGATMKLQLAAEEVIAALTPGVGIEIALTENADRITLGLTCHPRGMDLSAFNLAWRPDLETGASGLGLALASRYIDTFSLHSDEGGRLHLQFSIDKAFDAEVSPPFPFPEFRFYRLIKPSAEHTKTFAPRLFHGKAAAGRTPRFFHPDRLAALITEGRLHGTLAETETGDIAGVCFCIPEGPRMLGGYGPFVFAASDRNRIARDLACHTLERVARKPFSGLLATCFDADCFPAEYFIPAGRPGHADHGLSQATAWHFPLSDDAGGRLYYHEAAVDFIRETIGLQDLPRNMIEVTGPEPTAAETPSVFSATLNRGESKAVLRLLMPGGDIENNTDAHLEFFHQEGISFCEVFLDLGRPADAALIPILSARRFTPRLLIPGGGEGDLLVCERLLQPAGGAV